MRDALWQAMTGRRGAAPSADDSPAALVGYLAGLVGSKAGVARVLGVSPSTVYRWSAGKSRPKMSSQVIAAGIRAYAVATGPHPDILRTAGPQGKQLHLHAATVVSSDARVRTIAIGRYATARQIRAALRAWTMADDAKANRLMGRAVEEYAKNMEVGEVVNAWFYQ